MVFCSFEAEYGKYEYMPPYYRSEFDHPGANEIVGGPPPPPPPFCHNPLHDIESIWWMILWLVATRIVCKPDSKWNPTTQRDQLRKVFPVHFRTFERYQVFHNDYDLGYVFSSFDINLHSAWAGVYHIRASLISAYKKAENPLWNDGIDRSVWEDGQELHQRIKLGTAMLKTIKWPEVENWSAEKAKMHSQNTSH
jgi:hypothetical protein